MAEKVFINFLLAAVIVICTAVPAQTVAVPKAPHGLYVLLFPGRHDPSAFVESLRNNPVVSGAIIYVVWGKIDQGPGSNPRYDWSSVDEQIAPWVAAGKTVNLVVWATGYGPNRSKVTPAYVMAEVPTVSCKQSKNVPIFWSPEFVNNYQPFMKEVVQRYSDNPSIGYIRFGLSGGGETFPVCYFALKQKYEDFNRIWPEYIISMLDYEKTLNSPKLMVGLTPFGRPSDSKDYLSEVSAAALRDNIAIGIQGLQSSDMTSNGSASSRCWYCPIFNEHQGELPLEMQTFLKSQPEGGKIGSLVDLLPFGISQHAQIFEIYLQDWQIAYDPDDPQYGQYHAVYQQAFEKAQKSVH